MELIRNSKISILFHVSIILNKYLFMPNLKSIKVRIKSVKSTQKITQAMKLVAASKVRKAQVRVLNSRPYTQKVSDFVNRVVSSMSFLERQEIELMDQREIKSIGLIVITSDRGLCGSYNSNIVKRATKRILELKELNQNPKLIVVGNKANGFFRRTNVEILESFTQLPAVPTVELGNLIASCVESSFIKKVIDKAEIIGTDFISMLKNEVYIKNFLPIVPDVNGTNKAMANKTAEVLFEPSLKEILDNLLPLYLSNVIFHALLEASTSELASRMNAMSNATSNAKELIDNLTIVYNKARQAAITQELTEIVGGVEALK